MAEEEEIPSLEDLQKLRVVDLKKELQRLGLSQGGNKADLVKRIHEYYQEQSGEGGGEEKQEGGEEEQQEDDQAEEVGSDSNDAQEVEADNVEDDSPSPQEEDSTPDPQENVDSTPAPQEDNESAQSEEQEKEEEQVGSILEEVVEPQETEETSQEQPEEQDETPQEQEEQVEPAEEVMDEPKEEEKVEDNESKDVVSQPKLSVQLGAFKSHPAGAPTSQASQEQELEQEQPDNVEDVDEYGGGDESAEASPEQHKDEYGATEVEETQMETEALAPPVAVVAVSAPPAVVSTPLTVVSAPPAAVSAPPVAVSVKQQQYDPTEDMEDEADDEENEQEESVKLVKKGRKPKKKKKKKKNRPEKWAMEAITEHRRKMDEERQKTEQKVEIVYIQEELGLEPSDPLYRSFNKIFQAFKIEEEPKEETEVKKEEEIKREEEFKKAPKQMDDDDFLDDKPDEDGENKMSKRKLKKLSRLSVAELKQLVTRPDVVEMHDVTARDPRLLVHLKSTRNTVPVPRHWCFKRKYLQGKRGIEKPPFDLPDFIKKTGIMEMREALQEKEEAKGMKAKQREKVRPKLGKIDIDYQKLHDAFFKWQTKPKMTMHGDLYYEGKEFEIRLKEKKPGDLTDDLRTALGMPVGPNAHKVPPPWLIAMQRYGPPPSYPNLKISGLNAPIPEGCSFGYHAGGWGKPPVDESGKPLYGDVFGTSDQKNFPTQAPEEVDQTLWGEMESDSEDESESSEEEDEDEDGEGVETGLQTPVVDPGLLSTTPSGIASSIGGAGLETPDMIELRKRRIEADMEGGETPSLPYTVIPERQNARIGASMMGSTHTYDIKGTAKGVKPGTESAVEMALNPEDIEDMDSDAMALRAEAALREQQANLAKEDLSDMVAEHAAKQRNKRKRQEQKDDKDKTKKYKEFKF